MSFMDRAFRMRDKHEDVKNKAATRDPISGEEMELGEYDRSVAEITSDPATHDSFYNHFLYQQNAGEAKDIADSLASNTQLTDKQAAFIEKNRKLFNVLSANIEKVRERLTPEQIQQIAQIDPRIAQLVGQINPEQAANLLGQELSKLAMSDTKRFNRIAKGLQGVHNLGKSERARDVDRSVQQVLERYGLTEDTYIDATQKGLTADTQKSLEKAAKEQMGLFRSVMDSLSAGALSRRSGEKLYKTFEEQQKLLAECDTHFKSIGMVLRSTLTPDVRMAIQKHIVEGTSLTDTDTTNIKTIGEFRNVRNEYEPASIKAEYQRRLQEALRAHDQTLNTGRRGRTIDPIDAALAEDRIRDNLKEEVALEYADKINKYKGSGVLQFLLNLIFRPGGGAPLDKAAIKAML